MQLLGWFSGYRIMKAVRMHLARLWSYVMIPYRQGKKQLMLEFWLSYYCFCKASVMVGPKQRQECCSSCLDPSGMKILKMSSRLYTVWDVWYAYEDSACAGSYFLCVYWLPHNFIFVFSQQKKKKLYICTIHICSLIINWKFRNFNVNIYFSWIPIHASQAN